MGPLRQRGVEAPVELAQATYRPRTLETFFKSIDGPTVDSCTFTSRRQALPPRSHTSSYPSAKHVSIAARTRVRWCAATIQHVVLRQQLGARDSAVAHRGCVLSLAQRQLAHSPW